MEQPSSPSRTPVPSCVLVGRQLRDLALYDLDGKPWVLRDNRQGKLVLIDFWGTWCRYCLRGMPNLRSLQSRYNRSELEVLGIAYEQSGTPGEQAKALDRFCAKEKINYRILIGGGLDHCPVKTQFGVRDFPTLVLLDEEGWEIWKKVGEPSPADWEQLEWEIRRRLHR